jgi:CubicO group peptidase (beta-lactamase class C family)
MAQRLQAVAELFAGQHRAGAFPGGQLVVQRGDQRLLDVAIGTARGFRSSEGASVPVTPETRFQVCSASKAVLARVIARLEERGLIDVHAPVRRYIREFVAADVTVLDVLTHRSGVTLPELGRRPELWDDWGNIVKALRSEPPAYPRGTLAYQPMAFGWILTEVLQRITGETLEDFCARELGTDLAWRYAGPAASTYWLGAKRYLLNGANLAAGFEHVNNQIAGRTALVPGAAMYTTARALAAFYASMLDDPSEPLSRYTRAHTRGFDKITGAYVVLGCGFALGWRWPHVYAWWGSQSCFGHAGAFAVGAYADRATGTGIAIVTNASRSIVDLIRRFAPLGSAIRRSLREAS